MFFLFENIVDSPLNQSQNTREKTWITYTSNEKYIQYSSGKRTKQKKKKKKKKKKKTLYPEYRRFADFPQTLGIKPSKRNIRWTTLASPRKVCVMQSCAKLLGIIMLYPETFFHHIEQSVWRLYPPRSCGCTGWSESALVAKVLLSQKCFPNFCIPIHQN